MINKKVYVIGATTETREVCDFLKKNNINFIISVATRYGLNNFCEYYKNIITKRMDIDEMRNFLINENIDIIIDTSHPHATEVSKNAIENSNRLNICYIRYERNLTNVLGDNLSYFDDYRNIIEYINSKNFKNILITTGSKDAKIYIDFLKKKNLFIRTLPDPIAIKKLLDYGYLQKNIIAMQGPFSLKLNIALIETTKAEVVVTKNSGKAGGFFEKVKACELCNIECLVKNTEVVTYPKKIVNLDQLKILFEGIREGKVNARTNKL